MELQPETEAGRRFVDVIESHVAVFRERAPVHDRESSFPVENFAELRESGAAAAFVPESLGGFGLSSVHDWAIGIERLARGDASTAIALNMPLGISRNMAEAASGAEARGEPAGASAGMLQAIAAGQLLICATATEAGTDFLRPNTTATRTEDG
ncbi:MAG: acyl-CoA dehydrogenase family protein, partial [Myxococcota bacterium]